MDDESSLERNVVTIDYLIIFYPNYISGMANPRDLKIYTLVNHVMSNLSLIAQEVMFMVT